MFLLQLICIYYMVVSTSTKEFEFSADEKRVQRGRETYEQFDKDFRFKNSKCWRAALDHIDESCRQMSDIHQSYLALQFANCHLEKSGMDTYGCTLETFRECTNKMSPIAFNTYTQFFGQVTDICFYFQSEIWRDKTEDTILKLSESSKQALNVLSKSVQQQKEVLSAQEESLQNQQDIIKNENLLKETLLTSAQSAKDVFAEVREQAQQQKTMFSETFDNIFQSFEKLANVQNMLLGEFIGFQSIAFYLTATIVCYLFTSTPQTSGSRLWLFAALSLLIVSERVFVGKIVDDESEQLTSERMHERIWVLRKIFLVLATIILGIFIFRYKDFNKINYGMLQEIQLQVTELRKIQQTTSQVTTNCLDETDSSTSLEKTIIKKDQHQQQIEHQQRFAEAAKKLEMTVSSFVTSTPHKVNLSLLAEQTENIYRSLSTITTKEKKNHSRLAEFSDDDDVLNDTPTPPSFSSSSSKKKDRRKFCVLNTINENLNESRYNLRKRRSSINGTLNKSSNGVK
ncbi:uncharacterized protein [Clytia hemisphaerica]|uniref:Uncharacterized protein n=1 Tax=Clytia hemisphaerica TaxID=252671 RepID=A0A7M5WRJ9_9CNID|eukprot:TCONS_00053608-protein